MSKRTDLPYFGRMLDEARAIERSLAKASTEAEFTAHQDLPGANTYRLQTIARMAEKVLPNQRGRMQIEVEVTGKSCHGSMPWEGRNPLEYGAAIIVEAAQRYRDEDSFKRDAFLGGGTRTASWATLSTPSDCAVPERFTFR